MTHTCHAHGCTCRVPPKMFMCKAHWSALPARYKRAIWREYTLGHERRKDPTLRSMAVQQMAIGACAFKPHDEDAAAITANYTFRAMLFAAQAIEAGLGNPIAEFLPEGTEVPSSDQLMTLAMSDDDDR